MTKEFSRFAGHFTVIYKYFLDYTLNVWYNDTIKQKGGYKMPSDRESAEIKKAMAYDLIEILETRPEQQTYTADEVKKIIKNYITANTQK